MTEKEKYYNEVLSHFIKKYGVTEEELLEVYNQGDEGRGPDALKNLCERLQQPKLQYGYVHFYIAYRQLLRERGELKDG